jgi:hypothetical protein
VGVPVVQLFKGEQGMTIMIKDWNKFQHFKDRTPPWVKLYRDILDDPDWHCLDGDSAKTLVMLWLIASEDETHEGKLPDSRRLAFRLRITEHELKQVLNKLNHWLISDDIAAISPGYRRDAPETETETETETEIDKPVSAKRANRSSRLTSDFEPNETAVKIASELGVSVSEELPGFIDHHIGRGTTMSDWQAAFRTWIRNAKKFGEKNSGSPRRGYINGRDEGRAAAARTIAEFGNGPAPWDNDDNTIDCTKAAAKPLG